MSQIIIGGKPFTQLQFDIALDTVSTYIATRSEIYFDLTTAPDELTRAHQAAAVLTGGCVDGLIQKVRDQAKHHDTMQACTLGYEVVELALARFKVRWAGFHGCLVGKPEALPQDLPARGAALPDAFAALEAQVSVLVGKVDALDDGALIVDARALLDTLRDIVEGAAQSVELSAGKMETLPTADFNAALASLKSMVAMGCNSDKELEQKLGEIIGVTDDERRQFFLGEMRQSSAVGSEGTTNGAILAAEEEMAIAAEVVKRLDNLLDGHFSKLAI